MSNIITVKEIIDGMTAEEQKDGKLCSEYITNYRQNGIPSEVFQSNCFKSLSYSISELENKFGTEELSKAMAVYIAIYEETIKPKGE